MKNLLKLLFIFISLLLFYLLTTCGSEPDREAIEAFRRKDYATAERLLTQQRLEINIGCYILYKAYLLRANQQLNLSTAQLNYAIKAIAKQPSSKDALTLKEIHVNLLLNAYLTQDVSLLRQALERARPVLSDTGPWFQFFESLKAYLEKDYVKADQFLRDLPTLPYFSSWMKIAYSDLFSSEWISEQKLRIAIFSKQDKDVREESETALKSLLQEKIKNDD